jgi:hypothetical protein
MLTQDQPRSYFVDQNSRIRKISNPEEGFMFDKTKDERIAKLEAHALQREYPHPYPC